LFAYAVDLPANARTVTLPANDKIRILAITAAAEPEKVQPLEPLYDVLGSNE
jgi:alpha-mannosidase